MISERAFASSFSSFWRENFPLMSPGFVTLFHRVYEEPLKDRERVLLDELPPARLEQPEFIAELAFRMAKICQERSLSVLSNDDLLSIAPEAAEHAILALARFEGKGFAKKQISQSGILEAIRLCNRYDALYRAFPNAQSMQFCPRLKGAGILNPCEADISIGPCLVEVKAKLRPVVNEDLRQVFVYLALAAVQRTYNWAEFAIFNPRRGTICRMEVESLIRQLSGGRQPLDVFLELHSFLESSELQIE